MFVYHRYIDQFSGWGVTSCFQKCTTAHFEHHSSDLLYTVNTLKVRDEVIWLTHVCDSNTCILEMVRTEGSPLTTAFLALNQPLGTYGSHEMHEGWSEQWNFHCWGSPTSIASWSILTNSTKIQTCNPMCTMRYSTTPNSFSQHTQPLPFLYVYVGHTPEAEHCAQGCAGVCVCVCGREKVIFYFQKKKTRSTCKVTM